MKTKKTTRFFYIFLLIAGVGMYAFWFGDSASWKEEVLLHDGKKIVVKRSQSHGGRHEIGQSSPIKEQAISFTLPGTNKTVTWTSEYSEDIGRANFELLALHILNGTPYIVASPNLCLSYNKWGRPNPPYVFFRYDGETWRRVTLDEVPVEFSTLNLTIDTKGDEKTLVRQWVVSAELVKKLNGSLRQPEYKAILREPLELGQIACSEMIPTANGGWEGIEGFIHQPSYERCLRYCEARHVDPELCPCDRIFNKNNKEK